MMFKRDCIKGQAHVIGAVLVFSLGIVVLVGFAFLFDSVKTKAVSEMRSKTAGEILEYFAANAEKLQRMNATHASTKFRIPARIGDQAYIVSAAGDGKEIMLSAQDFSERKPLNANVTGSVDSSNDMAVLIYDNGRITIRGVSD